MTRFATLNVGRNGIVKSPQVRGLLIESRIQICALQEIDINIYSRINYVSQWKSFGYFVALGCPSPQNQCVRVALVSSSKMKQIWLPDIALSDRVVSALVEYKTIDGCIQKLLVCSIYAPVADEQAAVHLIDPDSMCCGKFRDSLSFSWVILTLNSRILLWQRFCIVAICFLWTNVFLLFSFCLPPELIVLVGSTLHLGVPQCFLLAFVMSRALRTTPL